MSFKGFIKTNYLRFIYINFLSIISGLGAIGQDMSKCIG